MKSTPILFKGPMVQAILDGRKTMTRRLDIPQPEELGFGRKCSVHPYCTGTEWPLAYYEMRGACWNSSPPLKPRYQVGNHLWVKETWMPDPYVNSVASTIYRATEADPDRYAGNPWKPSIFMPRIRSRITLEVTAVRIERLQDISNADARAEGCCGVISARFGLPNFRYVWDSINTAYPWSSNPFVSVYTFRRIKP